MERGICDGEVLFHSYVTKTQEEVYFGRITVAFSWLIVFCVFLVSSACIWFQYGCVWFSKHAVERSMHALIAFRRDLDVRSGRKEYLSSVWSTPMHPRSDGNSPTVVSVFDIQIKAQRTKVEVRDNLKRKRRDEQAENVARKKQAAEELAAGKATRRRERAERAAAQGDADEGESSDSDEVSGDEQDGDGLGHEEEADGEEFGPDGAEGGGEGQDGMEESEAEEEEEEEES